MKTHLGWLAVLLMGVFVLAIFEDTATVIEAIGLWLAMVVPAIGLLRSVMRARRWY